MTDPMAIIQVCHLSLSRVEAMDRNKNDNHRKDRVNLKSNGSLEPLQIQLCQTILRLELTTFDRCSEIIDANSGGKGWYKRVYASLKAQNSPIIKLLHELFVLNRIVDQYLFAEHLILPQTESYLQNLRPPRERDPMF